MRKVILVLILILQVCRTYSQQQSAGLGFEPQFISKFYYPYDHGFGFKLSAFYQVNIFRNIYFRTGFNFETFAEYEENFICPDCVGCPCPLFSFTKYPMPSIPLEMVVDFNYYTKEDPKVRGYLIAGYEIGKFLPGKTYVYYKDTMKYGKGGYPYDDALGDRAIHSLLLGINFSPRINEKWFLEFAPTFRMIMLDPEKTASINSIGLNAGIRYVIR